MAQIKFIRKRRNKMKQKIFSLVSLFLVIMLFTACAPQAETPAAVEDLGSLSKALRAAGATVEGGDTVEQPFFSVTGQILKINGADVQVFEYKSAELMEADAAQVSADGGSVGTSMVSWMATPYFFKTGRVLVLYVGDDAAILDLLKSVLGEQFAGR
jgi:hypothetical protein